MKTVPKKILIVKPSSLGDIVHALPAVRMLVRRFPDVQIDWVVRPAFAPLLDYFPNIDRKILFRRREMGQWKSFLPEFLAFLRELRREKYDAVLDMQGLLRSAIFTFCARSRTTFGPARSREFGMTLFYRRKIKIGDEWLHAIDRNIALVGDAFGIREEGMSFIPLQGSAKYADRTVELLHDEGISSGDTLFGVIPGANWPSKSFPAEFFAACIDGIANMRPDWKFVVFGTDKEAGTVSEIRQKSRLPDDRIVSLAGKTGLGELAEALRLMRGVCGGDTGAIHLAAAFGVPTVALYGATRPELTGVRSPRGVILRPEVDCLGCLQRDCPLPENLCYRRIDPAEAARAAVALCDGEER
ncbi:MAG: lipopolysaccharide heptosyltransferase I [Victivallaceae bacterium]|nr:lipopolysaccharide heptosyltransferase I [Victivallaceae bacterium]